MIILLKHIIFEICLDIIFSTVHINFQKPITLKKQIISRMVSNILFRAKAINSARHSELDTSDMIHRKYHIANKIDNQLLDIILDDLGKRLNRNDIT